MFPSFGPEPLSDRFVSIAISATAGDEFKCFFGDYYAIVRYKTVAGTHSVVEIYDSNDLLLGKRTLLISNTLLFGQGGVSHNITNRHPTTGGSSHPSHSLTVGAGGFCMPLPISGTEYGIEIITNTSGVTFDNLIISQNLITRTGDTPCTGHPCSLGAYSTGANIPLTVLEPEWEIDSGTWSRNATSGNIETSTGGKIVFTGGWGGANQIYFSSGYGGVGGQIRSFWIDDQQTGMIINLGSAVPPVSPFVEFYVEGVLVESVVDSITGTLDMWNTHDRVHMRMNNIIRSYDYTPPSTLLPAIESSGTVSCGMFMLLCRGRNLLDRIVTYGGSLCTGDGVYDITISGVTGDCAADVNATYRTSNYHIGGLKESCGIKRTYRVTGDWIPYDSNGTSKVFSVAIQVGNAVAFFEATASSVSACGDFVDNLSMTLIGFTNADGIDFSAATCVADKV